MACLSMPQVGCTLLPNRMIRTCLCCESPFHCSIHILPDSSLCSGKRHSSACLQVYNYREFWMSSAVMMAHWVHPCCKKKYPLRCGRPQLAR